MVLETGKYSDKFKYLRKKKKKSIPDLLCSYYLEMQKVLKFKVGYMCPQRQGDHAAGVKRKYSKTEHTRAIFNWKLCFHIQCVKPTPAPSLVLRRRYQPCGRARWKRMPVPHFGALDLPST